MKDPMKSKMLACYDYTNLPVDEEKTRWKISDEEIMQELERLADDHSEEFEPEDGVQKGDSVRCLFADPCAEKTKGSAVLLFPGQKLSGAEDAEEKVLGKKKGDCFVCLFKGHSVTLQVEKIVRRIKQNVDDRLIGKLQIPDVKTVEQYYQWFHKEHDAERRSKAEIAIAHDWLMAIKEHSTFEIDEEEKKQWIGLRARMAYRAMLQAGMDLKKQPDGTMLTEEEAIEKAKEMYEQYFVPYLIYCYFCEQDGFSVSQKDYEEAITSLAKERNMDVQAAFAQTDISVYREVTYQEHTFNLLKAEAEKYLEV